MAASRQRIKTTDLYKSIGMILDGYADEVKKRVDKQAAKASKTLVDDLKKDSPSRTGEYAKNWGRIREGGIYIVRNAKHWRLTHLLENPHRKRNGKGMVRAYPHIASAAKKAIQMFEDSVQKVIKGGIT